MAENGDPVLDAVKAEMVVELYDTAVPFTTRRRREIEVDGVDYNFVSLEVFQCLLTQGKFSESGEKDGVFYGTCGLRGERADPVAVASAAAAAAAATASVGSPGSLSRGGSQTAFARAAGTLARAPSSNSASTTGPTSAGPTRTRISDAGSLSRGIPTIASPSVQAIPEVPRQASLNGGSSLPPTPTAKRAISSGGAGTSGTSVTMTPGRDTRNLAPSGGSNSSLNNGGRSLIPSTNTTRTASINNVDSAADAPQQQQQQQGQQQVHDLNRGLASDPVTTTVTVQRSSSRTPFGITFTRNGGGTLIIAAIAEKSPASQVC